jgi:hypothetical protein
VSRTSRFSFLRFSCQTRDSSSRNSRQISIPTTGTRPRKKDSRQTVSSDVASYGAPRWPKTRRSSASSAVLTQLPHPTRQLHCRPHATGPVPHTGTTQPIFRKLIMQASLDVTG